MTLGVYVGLPYVERGCWDLVRRVYADEFGLSLPSFAGQALDGAEQAELAAVIAAHRTDWVEVTPGTELFGDAILFRVMGVEAHIGLVVRPGAFLHVFRGQTSCIESYRSPRWAQRVVGFYRHQGRL